MAIIQIRVDDDLKDDAQALYDELGLDLSTAIRMFLKKAIAVGGFPFDTKVDEAIFKALKALKHSHVISKENGNDKMTLDEINEEIRLAREERENNKCNIT